MSKHVHDHEMCIPISAGIVFNKTRKNEIFTENKNEKKREKNEIFWEKNEKKRDYQIN
jgi:hypothetical protein